MEAAGGVTEKANLNNVNLAFVLSDGCKIRIPSVDDVDDNIAIVSSNAGNGTILGSENGGIGAKVNINVASQSELEKLTGIGPSIAIKIIEYRIKNGKFNKIEDLKKVSGIGAEKYNGVKDEICVK